VRSRKIRHAADGDAAATFEFFDRLLRVSHPQVGTPQIRARVVKASVHGQRRLELPHRLVVTASVVVDHADVCAEDRGQLLDGLSTPDGCQRVIDLPFREQPQSHVMVGHRRSRVDFQRTLKCAFVAIPIEIVGCANLRELCVRLRELRVELERPSYGSVRLRIHVMRRLDAEDGE
jgi:hypothetical protein